MPIEFSVVAGGFSAGKYDLQRLPGYVIGVNDAGLIARCDALVSMDRLWTTNRWSRMAALAIPAWIREAALKGLPPLRPGWLRPFECDHKSSAMSDVSGVLNGTNSGLCALNLAYQGKPEVLHLYGFDLARGPNGEGHWYPPYPWGKPGGNTGTGRFEEWQADLAAAVRQCQSAGIQVVRHA